MVFGGRERHLDTQGDRQSNCMNSFCLQRASLEKRRDIKRVQTKVQLLTERAWE